ncbi:hypothetical protein LTR15_012378 [Elasticomyces elasticus]|nr:hypothetical protein LTR15_012378 [Elasticomyces elasticus]
MVKNVMSATASGNAPEKPVLMVTAQQSRFHTDAVDSGASKEIVIKDLSVSVGNRELLSNAELHLQPGRHYVLIGRNGVGKSTLLKALATGIVPGIPRSLRILLLGQTQPASDDDPDEASASQLTVFQHVLRSDRRRQRLTSEAQRLSKAMENTSDPTAIVQAYRELAHQRLEDDVSEAKQTAARRSGVRGLEARKTLVRLEEAISQSSDRLALISIANDIESDETATGANETQKALDMLADVQSSLEAMNASAAEAKVRSVLLGLGFSEQSLDKPMLQLSGGWQTRCSLACALCQSADLLLLDEPTNFLDLPSIIWLETYLQNLRSGTTVIVVSHDRAFADAVGDELLVLRNQLLEHFRGSLSGYEVDRLKTYKHLSQMKDAQEKQKKHMQATIDQNVKAAKRAGDDKKLKQAASRRKKLDERMGMEVSAKGTRFKLNRDLQGFHSNRRNEIDLPTFDPPARMAFSLLPSVLRFPGPLASLENVSFSYRQGKQEVPVLTEVNLTIHLGDRVGLVGLNGSGKSTLVSLMMAGVEEAGRTLVPNKGTILRHPRARCGRYSQQAVEELDNLAAQHPNLTALAHIIEVGGSELSEKEARGLLASLGLAGKSSSDIPITLLSGGQKVRLALAKLLWMPPHLLILDEVTTHLDPDTIQALALALRQYEGAVLVITHDRFFMRCVVEGESPESLARKGEFDDDDGEEEEDSEDDVASHRVGVVYQISKGKFTKLEGGMQQYQERAAKRSAKLGKA